MLYRKILKQLTYFFSTTLIIWGCGESNDPTSPSNDVGFIPSSSENINTICQNGEDSTDFSGIYYALHYVCSDNQWILAAQSPIAQPASSSHNTNNISTCQEGVSFTDGILNYVCIGSQWVPVEQPTSSSQNLLIISSSSIKAKSSSSTKSSSSAKAAFSSSEAECNNGSTRNIWLQNSYTTDTSTYKIVTRTLYTDICKNEKWDYPSNVCDLAVTGKPVPSENRVINGVRYHIWCDGRLYFDLACDKEGDKDTIIDKNGEIVARICVKSGSWAQVISTSSSSMSQSSSSSSLNINYSYGTLTDTRDGKTYKTIIIGTQTWMAENLDFDGKKTFYEPYIRNYTWASSEPRALNVKGKFYYWSAAMDSAGLFSNKGYGCGYNEGCSSVRQVQGICPIGWHLPDTSDFNLLIQTVGGKSIAGKMLKSTQHWRYNNGLDDYGFSALPCGFCYLDGVIAGQDICSNVRIQARFITSTENKSQSVPTLIQYETKLDTLNIVSKAYAYAFNENDTIDLFSFDKRVFFYNIRCLKN